MIYTAPAFVWCVAALIGIYWATISYFMNYLKRVHRDTWLELGSPSPILNNSIRNGSLTLRFLFSGKYRALNDPKLAKLVWAIRGLLFLCIAGLFVAKWLGYK